MHAAKTLMQAFISSRLDYCNALLCGVSDGLMRRLQSVQKADARLVTGARRRDHITPIIRQLHWLPVRQRVTFKIAVLVFQCLTVRHRRIWQTTVSLLPMSAHADSDRPTQRCASLDVSQFRRPVFCGCWITPVEHVASQSTAVRQSRTV